MPPGPRQRVSPISRCQRELFETGATFNLSESPGFGRTRLEPYPRGWVECHIAAESKPARRRSKGNAMPLIRDVKQPIKRGQVECKTAHVSNAKSLPASFAKNRCQQESRRHPSQSRETQVGKGCREHQTGQTRQQEAAGRQGAERIKFQMRQNKRAGGFPLLRTDPLGDITQDTFEDFSILGVIFAHRLFIAGFRFSIMKDNYHVRLDRNSRIVSSRQSIL